MNTKDEYIREYLCSVSTYRTLLKHRLALLDSLTLDDLATIGTGIVFVHASWSGQSRVALQTIAMLLNEARFDNVWLYIVCIDKVDLGREIYGNVRFGGYGETLWLRSGQVVYTGSDYRESELAELRTATEQLLSQ